MDAKHLKTRFAPSPTGPFHLGSARTAYFNWLAARATGGKFNLRIDDTDAKRCDEKYVDEIVESMRWLGLDWDNSFRQSENARCYEIYHGFWTEWPCVAKRSDGSFTYHFASVVDDFSTDVQCIIRGVDHEPNLALQQSIWGIICDSGWMENKPFPVVHHVGLVHMNGKLSKRKGAKSVLEYRDEGYSPEAILNAILRLGWSPSDAEFDRKYPLIDREMAKELFWTAGKMHKRPSRVDMQKLDWYNRKYRSPASPSLCASPPCGDGEMGD